MKDPARLRQEDFRKFALGPAKEVGERRGEVGERNGDSGNRKLASSVKYSVTSDMALTGPLNARELSTGLVVRCRDEIGLRQRGWMNELSGERKGLPSRTMGSPHSTGIMARRLGEEGLEEREKEPTWPTMDARAAWTVRCGGLVSGRGEVGGRASHPECGEERGWKDVGTSVAQWW